MRRATMVGLLAGLLVGAIALGAIALSLGPTSIQPPVAPLALVSPTPTATPDASTAPSASPSVGGPDATPSGSGSFGPSPSAPPGSGPLVGLKVGQLAPALVLPRVGGGTVDLASLHGTPVWLAFTASWCPSCRDEMSLMDAAAAQYGSKLAIVAVDVKEDAATAASLASQTGFVATMGLDRDGAAQQTFGALVLPLHYFIDKDGIIRDVLYGEAGVPEFAAGIRSVVPGAASFAP
ncbi:MAG: redoxin domain-containing protein [Candidatus Limnocylindrales bacterium]